MKIYEPLSRKFDEVPKSLTENRKTVLDVLAEYITTKHPRNESVVLNFICTHNSRRSQLAQAWAQAAAAYFDIDVHCLSGGVEVTAFNERAVAALQRAGFKIVKTGGSDNPEYLVQFSDSAPGLRMFSKLFDDKLNESKAFAAVMVCSHADANCPFIPGTEKRIALTYDDPKDFDDTPLETVKYDERSDQIAGEMYYIFLKVKEELNESQT